VLSARRARLFMRSHRATENLRFSEKESDGEIGKDREGRKRGDL